MNVRNISVITIAMTTIATGLSAQELTQTSAGTPAAETAPQRTEFVPMTRSERLRDYLDGTFGVGALAGSSLHADVAQLTKVPKEWGHDPGSYAKRFGSIFAQHFVRKTLEYGAASILHEDNRYIRSGQKGFWKRSRYAVASSFLARHDNGRRGFSFSKVGSAAGAAFISRAWLPGSVAGAAAGAGSFGATIGIGVGSNVLREFWPDIKRRFRRH